MIVSQCCTYRSNLSHLYFEEELLQAIHLPSSIIPQHRSIVVMFLIYLIFHLCGHHQYLYYA
jgi:hypothetical protein